MLFIPVLKGLENIRGLFVLCASQDISNGVSLFRFNHLQASDVCEGAFVENGHAAVAFQDRRGDNEILMANHLARIPFINLAALYTTAELCSAGADEGTLPPRGRCEFSTQIHNQQLRLRHLFNRVAQPFAAQA